MPPALVELNLVVFYVTMSALAVVIVGLLLFKIVAYAKKPSEAKINSLLEQGNVDEAVKYLLSKGATSRAAQLLVSQGKWQDGIELHVKSGNFLEAAQIALEAGELTRAGELFQLAEDYVSAAGCYIKAGKIEDGVLLIKEHGDFITGGRILEASGYPEEAGRLYLEAGDHSRLVPLALEKIDDKETLDRIAEGLANSGAAEAAIEIYRKAKSFLRVGQLCENLGRHQEAIDAYLRHDYFEEAARVYSRLKDHEQAARLYLKAGVLKKAVREFEKAGEFLVAARIYRRINNHAKAIEALDQIPSNSPNFHEGMLLAASILEEHHRFNEAIERYRRILNVEGYEEDNLEVLYRLVDLQIHIQDIDSAVKELEKAKRAGLDNPAIDEQLMLLRVTPTEELARPAVSSQSAATKIAVPGGRTVARRASTTIGFPQSDRYTLKRKLARGGHGILFLVYDHRLGFDVVLKLLHSESLPTGLAKRYFLREAKTAARLDHPNIVKVFDYGELQGRPYLSMEYVDGKNLLELQEALPRPLTIRESLHISLQVCSALSYAHERSIIHRDIKMENIMVNRKWHVKLMDFGLAKALDENPDKSLLILGTPFYMSPEQIVGGNVDARSDLYSFGVLMFRLFTGKLPFEEGEVLTHHKSTPPPDPREFNPDLPPIIAQTVLKCLEKDPNKRFQSAEEIAGIFGALIGGGQVR